MDAARRRAQTLVVLATDPEAPIDLRRVGRARGSRLVLQREREGLSEFELVKAG